MLKINEEVFWTCMHQTGGLFGEAAKLMEKATGLKISRRDVFDRAIQQPELLTDILENTLDLAESVIIRNMRSEDPMISQRAAEFFLKTRGKSRGYVEKIEQEVKEASTPNWKDRIAELREE